jgi:hypothetical protein
MNTSIISDMFGDLSMPSVHAPDLSVPDVDTDAIVGWARRMLPFVSRRSFVRRHLVPLGLTAAAAGVIAFFIIRRKKAGNASVSDFRIDHSMQQVA